MQSVEQDQLVQLLASAISGFLLKRGVSWEQFQNIAQKAFEGTLDIETNSEPVEETVNFHDICASVFRTWHTDVAYLDEYGGPIPLSAESLMRLIKTVVARFPTRTEYDPQKIWAELDASEMLKSDRDDHILPVQQFYMPKTASSGADMRFVRVIYNLIRTFEHNAYSDHPYKYFDRSAVSRTASPTVIPLFRGHLRKHGTQFLESVDDWLAAHEATEDTGVRLGCSIFMFVEARSD